MNKLTSLVFCAGLVFAFGSPVTGQEHVHLHHNGQHHDVIVHDAECHVPVHHSFVSGNHCGHVHHSATVGCIANHGMYCGASVVLHNQWQHHTSCCVCPSHQIVSHQAHPHWGINEHQTHSWHPHHIAGCHGNIVHDAHHATLHSPVVIHSHDAVNENQHTGSAEEHAHYTTTTPEHGDHPEEPNQHEPHEDENDE